MKFTRLEERFTSVEILRVKMIIGQHFLLTCKTFDVCEKNTDVFVSMNVDSMKLIRHKRPFVSFRSDVLDYLSSHEVGQNYT